MPVGDDSKSRPMNKIKKKKALFEYYAPQASHVYVAGAFNDWKLNDCPLKKDRDGKWKTELMLPLGKYEYRYLVDDVWENDQRPVECVPNVFGSWNCVVTVS